MFELLCQLFRINTTIVSLPLDKNSTPLQMCRAAEKVVETLPNYYTNVNGEPVPNYYVAQALNYHCRFMFRPTSKNYPSQKDVIKIVRKYARIRIVLK